MIMIIFDLIKITVGQSSEIWKNLESLMLWRSSGKLKQKHNKQLPNIAFINNYHKLNAIAVKTL